MTFDNLDDWEVEVSNLPPQDEAEARHLARQCSDVFNRPILATKPVGQTKLDFGQQQEMFHDVDY